MNYYKALIQYDGTGYFGFQWQIEIPTIQNEFNQAIKSLVSGKVTTMGASRTDTGVHALEQVVKISCEEELSSSIMGDLNRTLPSQIKVLNVSPCDGEFRPSSSHLSKEYRYFFTNEQVVPQDHLRFMSNISNPLNIDLVNQCLSQIIGNHDFVNFCSLGSNVTTTTREIFSCELSLVNPHIIFADSIFKFPSEVSECFQLKFSGSGFLKQMIRHLVSALWMVGSGKLSVEDFSSFLQGQRKEKQLWRVAPANGLFLFHIHYPKD